MTQRRAVTALSSDRLFASEPSGTPRRGESGDCPPAPVAALQNLAAAQRTPKRRAFAIPRQIAVLAVTLIGSLHISSSALGASAQFDGVNDWLSVALNEPETGVTHEFWFKTASPDRGLFSVQGPGSTHDRDIWIEDGAIKAKLNNNSGDETISSPPLNLDDDQWHHVAHVFGSAAAGQKLYVDGVLRASGVRNNSNFTTQDQIAIGYTQSAPSDFMSGRIDDVRIWNVVRTEAQIKANMVKTLIGTESGLILYLPFNEGTGTTSADLATASSLTPAAFNNGATWSTAVPFGTISGTVSGVQGGIPGVTVTLAREGDVNSVYDTPIVTAPTFQTNVTSLNFYPSSTTSFNAAWPANPVERWGAVFEGELILTGYLIDFLGKTETPTRYNVTFSLGSNEGAILLVDGEVVVSRNFISTYATTTSAVVQLTPGDHRIEVRYFANTGNSGLRLELEYDIVGTTRTTTSPIITQTGVNLGHSPKQVMVFNPPALARFWSMNGPTAITTTDASGNYTFPDVLRGEWAEQITASKTDYVFFPSVFTGVVAPISGRNFTATQSPPAISVIPAQTTPEDTALLVPFTVGDGQTAASSLTLTVASTNLTLLPLNRITLGGSGENRSVTLDPYPNATGTSLVTLTVTDGTNTSSSSSFLLTVTPVNDAPVGGLATAMRFDGVDDYLILSSANVGNSISGSEITIEFWQKVDAVKQQVTFAASPTQTTNRIFAAVPHSDGKVIWDFGDINGDGRLSYTPSSSIVGSWQHFALVASQSGSFMRIYRNGVLEAEKATMDTVVIPSNYSFRIGGITGSFFGGEIAEFRVWNVARTEDQIRANRSIPLSGTESGLTIYYRFNDGSGIIVADSARSAANQAGAQDAERINGPLYLSSRTESLVGLKREVYSGLGSSTDLTDLTNNAKFPNSPNIVQYLATPFEMPINYGANYGQRVSGWIVPPTTGSYTFYISSDNASTLFLSTDADPSNKVVIASVAISTGSLVWNTFPSQQSSLISLVEGQRYYMEALMKEASGADHLAVGWQLPNSTLERPIPFNRFASTNELPLVFEVTKTTPTLTTDLAVILPAFDVDSTLTYTIVTPPGHGTLTQVGAPSSPHWIYRATLAYVGTDQFTYQATDGTFSVTNAIYLRIGDINVPPTISAIPNAVIEEGTVGTITFEASDFESATSALILTALSSDQNLVRNVDIQFQGTGTNRTGQFTHVAGEVGTVTLQFSVFDGQDSRSVSFDLKIEPKPAFVVIDMGVLPNRTAAYGTDINDQGQVVGYQETSQGVPTGFLFSGLGNGGQLSEIVAFNQGRVKAWGINNSNVVVGQSLSNGNWRAFSYDGLDVQDLGVLSSATNSVGFAINDLGVVVGASSLTTGKDRAFNSTPATGTITLTNLGVLAAPYSDRSVANGVNFSNQFVGAAFALDGSSRAFIGTGTNLLTDLGVLVGGTNSVAYGLNRFGQVVGQSTRTSSASGTTQLPRAFLDSDGAGANAMTDLGTLPEGKDSLAYAINDFGQVVGYAYSSNDLKRAFLYTAGKMHDLNDLIPEGTGWRIEEARAINKDGAIVGTGKLDGQTRAFLALPANIIGKQVPRPQGAVARIPLIELISDDQSRVDDSAQNSFHWSDADKKLYAIRPVKARLTWFTTFSDISGGGANLIVLENRITVITANTWPKDPTIHVGSVPVQVEPRGVPFDYSFQGISYNTMSGVTFDSSSKNFNATQPGYSVLYYLKTDGFTPDPSVQRPLFEVIRTYNWHDPFVLIDNHPWFVGDTLSYSNHVDRTGRNGFVWFENSPYDGVGTEKAYDRIDRRGPIIPVNLDTASTTDDMVVVWYQTNRIGVAWANQPIRYSLAWDDDTTNKIIIASTLGSGVMNSGQFTQIRVYSQPDPSEPGFNPNEEHALIAPSGSGEAIYALRTDLNANFSEPFALLKYKDPADNDWHIRPYKVVAEEDPYFFVYPGEAGKEIAPPLPLSVLQLCADSHGVSGPYWEDFKGKLYARAAGNAGRDANVVIHWYYPLMPDFFYDFNTDGVSDVTVGTCIPWLNRLESGTTESSPPVDVTYNIRWPDVIPVLQIGETLFNPKRELPGVRNWANAMIIYDDLAPNAVLTSENKLLDVTSGLARLFDPLSDRHVDLGADFEWPASIKRVNRNGKEEFTDLPFALRVRLKHDPINHWLMFGGYLDESGVGSNPLLLPNVMSERERDRIKELSSDSNWEDAIDDLYDLTRNPNQVDVVGDGDTDPDKELRLGLTRSGDDIVVEQFGDLPKALTAAFAGVPPAQPDPGSALQFDGNDSITLPNLSTMEDFTISVWAKIDAANTGCIFSNYVGGSRLFLRPEAGVNRFVLRDTKTGLNEQVILFTFDPLGATWYHLSLVRSLAAQELRLYINGSLIGTVPSEGMQEMSGFLIGNQFRGQLDEFRIWSVAHSASQIKNQMNKRLSGAEDALRAYYRFDETSGTMAIDSVERGTQIGYVAVQGYDGTIDGAARIDSTAPAGIPPRYITLVENNDPALGSLPISLKIIQVDDGPYLGDIKVLLPDNVFDERLTLRHSGDFGGEPGLVQFEWYYKPDSASFDPTLLPLVGTDGTITETRGWLRYFITPTDGRGVNDITIGEGGESGLLTLGDNWFICRYRGYSINLGTANDWSDWIGDPASAGTTRAALAEGWIKRVIRGLNPFDARTADFHAAAVNTFASMLVQAGPRYEGDIAFNPSADAINGIGLIEAYETVLRRGKSLSIEGVPPVNFDPANNALMLATTKIADLYTVVGNEAYADAQDPTIGFGTTSGEYGTAASSIFAFQNQLDSLLEEELVLLRGRDDQSSGVGAAPVYARLFWNFTLADGEVAYKQTYNISDQNFDGFIDEKDARILYPQGHGDAWGHYLTAIDKYYDLLRHPMFTWIPRTESVNVAGTAVQVDFLDERKFANLAAAKAKVGKEIMDLTYRLNYVDDPAGQWQGYKDTDKERGWGVAEWAQRAGQAALFDWITANTILPAVDPNPDHTGIQKIDRTTVTELADIAAAQDELQRRIDDADTGLNPFGLAKGVVPFDIDPAFLTSTALAIGSGTKGRLHFEQILDRALKAMKNAVTVFNQANQATELLRRSQDSVQDFNNNVRDQERDYKSRLIEIFGYPYAGDIGAGQTYPSGYDGPDLYHYMYVDQTEITGVNSPPSSTFSGFFTALPDGVNNDTFFPGSNAESLATDSILEVKFPFSTKDFGFVPEPSWGKRRAPGEIQMALSDLLQAEGRFKQAVFDYANTVGGIGDQLALLQAHQDLNAETIKFKYIKLGTLTTMNAALLTMKAVEVNMRRTAGFIKDVHDAVVEGLPKVVGLSSDFAGPARATIKAAARGSSVGLTLTADNLSVAQTGVELAKVIVDQGYDISLELTNQMFEVSQRIAALKGAVGDEAVKRLEVYNQREIVIQAVNKYLSTLAQGLRLVDERVTFRKRTSAEVTDSRYQDMTFRIFRNDALQKYRAQFDLAARYVFLAATTYDYEVNLLGTDTRAGQAFLTDIVRQRSLGELVDDEPVAGRPGLADTLARLSQNFDVLKPQFGLNNPQLLTTRFSLRQELFRIGAPSEEEGDMSNEYWRTELRKRIVANLWDVPDFRRYCRPFAPESAGAQPGIVIRFPTTITFAKNLFGWPLAGGDSNYDPSRFATKINSVGIWLSDSDGSAISQTPRLYLFPVGMDILASPTGDNTLATREWRVVDQQLPVPFPIGATALKNPGWIPMNDSLGGSFAQIRRFASLPAYHDSGIYSDAEYTFDSRLVGRSVWNSEWVLIIPGGTLLADPNEGIGAFIDTVSDIKLYFHSYSFAGN